ncbi:thioredoxin family protein [Rhodophyticola sp. SM2404]
MNRRHMMLLAGSALVLPRMGLASMIDYTPGLVDEHLARGETVFVDFFAPWCSTCRAQDRVVEELRGANSAYDSAMTFIRVDWDTYGTGELAQRLQIPRRSTLVVLRGDEELGRIVAGTSQGDIQALMDLGLS